MSIFWDNNFILYLYSSSKPIKIDLPSLLESNYDLESNYA